MAFCAPCDDKVEHDLPLYLSEYCDCDQYRRWICVPCREKETDSVRVYFKTRTRKFASALTILKKYILVCDWRKLLKLLGSGALAEKVRRKMEVLDVFGVGGETVWPFRKLEMHSLFLSLKIT